MSAWDAYITNMKASGLQLAGIFGPEGGVWAKSPELKASQEELAKIVNGIKGKSFPEGIHLGGVKYTVISTTPDSVTAKCRNPPTDAEKYLIHAALAKTCCVVGGIAGAAERSTTKFVEDIRDYLVKSNY